jgi:hypothetical protein
MVRGSFPWLGKEAKAAIDTGLVGAAAIQRSECRTVEDVDEVALNWSALAS